MLARASLILAFSLGLGGTAQSEVSINAHQTKNMVCSGGVCSPTAKGAYLNVKDLENLLQSSDVKVTTGAGAVTMGVDVPLTWTSSHRLTLDAIYRVDIKAPVTVAGAGALTVTYNDGGSGGDFLFFNGAKIDFSDLKSSLIIEGNNYTLSGDLQSLTKNIKANPSGFHALASDYDAGADGSYDNSVIGGTFKGVFEGLGHTVANLSLGQSNCENGHLGFFFDISAEAAARDFALADANGMSCTGTHTALFVATNHGLIEGISVSGSLQSTGGGGVFMIGGVAAANFDGLVTRSQSSVDIMSQNTGGSAAGDLVGWSNGTITLSHATGSVSAGSRTLAGGLAGYAVSVDQSYATGPVSTGKGSDRKIASAGGLIGSGAASNSYAMGSAQGGDGSYVGGLLGFGANTHSAYSTVAVSGATGATIGGFIGHDGQAGDLSKTYWDLDTSGVSSPGQGAGNIPHDRGITGLSDPQLRAELPRGFDPNIWGQSPSINNGYPYLLANPPQ